MIRKVRIKFVTVTMIIVVAVMLVFCGAILLMNITRTYSDARQRTERILEYYGLYHYFPDLTGQPGRIDDLRSFILIIDADGKIANGSLYSSEVFELSQLQGYADSIIKADKKSGTVGCLYYSVQKQSSGYLIAATDISTEQSVHGHLLFNMAVISALAAVGIFGIVWVLSYRVISPVKNAMDKQRQFISNASHELKTPLTIINTSNEMILNSAAADEEIKKWGNTIRGQAERLAEMTGGLLTLSKIDELKRPEKLSEVNLSECILSAALSFESVAYEQHKQYSFDIEKGLKIKAEPDSVREAAAILIDNAIKYSGENGTVEVKLSRQFCLTVVNSGSIHSSDKNKIFERFYRGENVRGDTNGSGLGLSILSALTQLFKWTVEVDSEDGKTVFRLYF